MVYYKPFEMLNRDGLAKEVLRNIQRSCFLRQTYQINK